MTNVTINRPANSTTEKEHYLEGGQYYLDTSPNADGEIYLVFVNMFDNFTLVDIQSGLAYNGYGGGMGDDDADFVLLNNVTISYNQGD